MSDKKDDVEEVGEIIATWILAAICAGLGTLIALGWREANGSTEPNNYFIGAFALFTWTVCTAVLRYLQRKHSSNSEKTDAKE
jgi:hypothetical protein